MENIIKNKKLLTDKQIFEQYVDYVRFMFLDNENRLVTERAITPHTYLFDSKFQTLLDHGIVHGEMEDRNKGDIPAFTGGLTEKGKEIFCVLEI